MAKPTGNKRGRRPGALSESKSLEKVTTGPGHFYVPTKTDLDRVIKFTLLGLPEETIAAAIGSEGVSVPTLRAHYHREIERTRNEYLSKIAHSAFRCALDPKDGGIKGIPENIRMAYRFFILKTRAGWKENDTTVINAQNVQIVKRVIGVADEDV